MFAVTDLLRLGFIREVTPGTTPATPAFNLIRTTGEGLEYNPSVAMSAELNAQRMLADTTLTSIAAGGSLNFELAYNTNFNSLWEALFCSTYGTALNGGAAPAGWTLGNTLWWGGTTYRYHTFEKTVFDTAGNPFYFRFPGSVLNKATLNFNAGAIITGTLDVLSRDAPGATTAIVGSTYVAESTNPIMRAPLFNTLKINGSASTTTVKQMQVQINNNFRALPGLGYIGPRDTIAGRAEVKLTGQLYFEDLTYYNFLTNQTTTFSMEFWQNDDVGTPNTYKFYFPKLKMAKAKIVAGGINQDLLVDFEANALLDTTLKSEMAISK